MDGVESNLNRDLGANNATHEQKEASIRPYLEIKLPDGRLVRQCRASDFCPMSKGFIEKRVRMEDHLRHKHGLNIKIPKRKVGRPCNKEIAARPPRCFPHPHAEHWKKQAQQRSMDQDKKFKKNRRQYECLQYLMAEESWNALSDECKISSKEEYITTWVKERMANYMSTSSARLSRIQKGIKARAGKAVNVKDVPTGLHVVLDDLDKQEGQNPENRRDGDEQPKDDEDEGEDQCKGDEDDSDALDGDADYRLHEHGADQHEDDQHVLDKGEEQCEGDEDNGETLGEDASYQLDEHELEEHGLAQHGNDLNAFKATRKKLPIRSTRRLQSGKIDVPIAIPSPTSSEGSTECKLTFQIHNLHVTVQQRGNGRIPTTRGDVARDRLNSGVDMEFVSMRSDVFLAMNERLLRDILVDQASTPTMNLFVVWMENILPSDILEQVVFVDAMWSSLLPIMRDYFLARFFSRITMPMLSLCFFPVIYRRHWSLFAFSLNKHKNLLHFKGRRSYLLYFDSLGLTDPKDCLENLYSALKCLAPYVSDLGIQTALFNPSKHLELKIIEVPQQPNGTDCGFFVIAFMRYLIAGVLQSNIDKSMLTKNWFQHEDVCALRMELHTWCLQVLSEL